MENIKNGYTAIKNRHNRIKVQNQGTAGNDPVVPPGIGYFVCRSAGATGTTLPMLACSTCTCTTLGLTPTAASVSAPLYSHMPEPVSSRTAGSARDLKESISAPTVWKEKNGSTRAWVEPSLWRHTKQETPMEAASSESESCHT